MAPLGSTPLNVGGSWLASGPVLQCSIVNELWNLLTSPLGPALVLIAGSIIVFATGRWLRRTNWQSGLALFFWAIAVWQIIALRVQPVVPIYSRPWQPFLLSGANLLWIGDGWNWYVSCLILLLGGVAILLSGFGGQYVDKPTWAENRRATVALSAHLGVLATALLFVGSGNLLTVTLTWVAMDVLVLARSALVPLDGASGSASSPAHDQPTGPVDRAQGLSLLGALLLLIGLLPAGPAGPGQPLQGGSLPEETVILMLVAAAIRAGAYPFHWWLLPANRVRMALPNRFIDHMVPALGGLWLLGWSIGLGGETMLLRPEFLAVVVMALLGSALAAYTATEKPGHTTFVLVTSVGVAGLAGILSASQGPSALIWPTTAFALGGGLWLVGERVWREWGWQLPVSVGALALVGVPFTPGFLSQPSIARLMSGAFGDGLLLPFFAVYILAQTLQVSALLRSWGAEQRSAIGLASPVIWRLLAASIALALPLVIVGIFPRDVAALASMPTAIPASLGNPPSAVAGPAVWITLTIPLLLGMGLAIVRSRLWSYFGPWPDRICRFAGLEWLSRFSQWSAIQTSSLWESGLSVLEGAGYIGWLVTFLVVGYFLLN